VSAALDDFLRDARAASVLEYARRLGAKTRGLDEGLPCPGCGGRDRFSVNSKKNLWFCRVLGSGGDAIALAQHARGFDFLPACEEVLQRGAPDRGSRESVEDRAAREAELARREREAQAREAARERDHDVYKERERKRAHDLWASGRAARRTLVEDYLKLRGLELPEGARLRFMPRAKLWNAPFPKGKVIHAGPAMVAAIEGPDRRFAGAHLTYLDLASPKGKASIVDPDTGEVLPAKKVRGSKKGGSIFLGGRGAPPVRIFIGEGIETVLAVRGALRRAGSPLFEGSEFRSSVDLGNIAGKALGSIAHPTAKRVNSAGREYALRVRNSDIPDVEPWPVIPLPASVEELVLLGDGDSDAFTTELALRRAAKRFSRAYPGLSVRIAMAADGMDFNDMLLAGEHRSAAE
jgi:hypothetical protein